MRKKTTDQLHSQSLQYLETTSVSYRKKMGQYFTPNDVKQHLFSKLPYIKNSRLLDPACGSGEFLLNAAEYLPDATLYGWDIDKKLTSLSRKLVPEAKIITTDALKKNTDSKFDYIIGNPPYFEFKPTPEIREKYMDVIKGRCNIFSLFIKLGLDNLNSGGYLAYIIPPSMNNGAYFAALRNYIINHSDIIYLKLLKSPAIFNQAQQAVMVMILKKGNNSGKYIFNKNGLTIFTPDLIKLKRVFNNKYSLEELGFKVATGKIVWNQHRSKLTDSDSKGVLLVWSHNIKSNKLILKNHPNKKQYIKSTIFDTGPAIIVNRVTGHHSTLSLRSAVIGKGVKFLAENHVNVIYPPKNITFKQLKKISGQISSKSTIESMKLITGNTQISKTELAKLLPVDLNYQ
jgi:adenine-specific DNA-methyltransferase